LKFALSKFERLKSANNFCFCFSSSKVGCGSNGGHASHGSPGGDGGASGGILVSLGGTG